MPRHGHVPKRVTEPDPVYGSVLINKIVRKLMYGGKKSKAEIIVYSVMSILKEKTKKDPLEVLEKAIKNVQPLMEVKPRRVGGSTYQVPIEVAPDRGQALAIQWVRKNSRARAGKSMIQKLSDEILDAYNNTGASIKKREDTHKMAEANKAFAHFRW